jgi:hypothetical protein
MTAKRRKPLLVNLTWVCVLVAPAAYFGSWLGLSWLYGRGVLGLETAVTLETTVYRPLNWYSAESGLPGGEFLIHMAERCVTAGIDSQK